MLERLALVKLSPQRVLDAGCGEGADLLLLQTRFDAAQLIGIDASAAMAGRAASLHARASSTLDQLLSHWIPALHTPRSSLPTLLCGNFAQLPLPPQSVDLVWSNLALHWHPHPDQVIAEWRRVLRTDGLLMFSCFGPDTFKELRAAFDGLDSKPHALPFVDMHDLGDMLVQAGFSTPVMDMESLTLTYRQVDKMLAEVRALGGNPLATRRRGLIGRRAWQGTLERVERMRRVDGTIGLSFEIIYGHAFRPAPKTTSRGESIVRMDFPSRR